MNQAFGTQPRTKSSKTQNRRCGHSSASRPRRFKNRRLAGVLIGSLGVLDDASVSALGAPTPSPRCRLVLDLPTRDPCRERSHLLDRQHPLSPTPALAVRAARLRPGGQKPCLRGNQRGRRRGDRTSPGRFDRSRCIRTDLNRTGCHRPAKPHRSAAATPPLPEAVRTPPTAERRRLTVAATCGR